MNLERCVVQLVQEASEAQRVRLAAPAEPLLADPGEGQLLLRTLEHYLRANGSTSVAARSLFVHRNTVRYRLAALVDLCEVGVTTNTERLAWTLALVALGRHEVLSPL